MREAIDKTRQYLKTSENLLFWSLYIVRELCKNDHNLVIKWLAECIKIRLSESKSPHITQLEKSIQEALNAQKTASECFEISRKIWDLKPGRDDVQIAVHNLWAVIGFYKTDKASNIMTIANAVEMISTEEELVTLDRLKRRSINNYRLSELYIEAALKIYNEYQDKK